MVILYIFGGLAGGIAAAGFGLVQGLAWYIIIGLYSAGGVTVSLISMLFVDVVLTFVEGALERIGRSRVLRVAAAVLSRLEHGLKAIGFQ